MNYKHELHNNFCDTRRIKLSILFGSFLSVGFIIGDGSACNFVEVDASACSDLVVVVLVQFSVHSFPNGKFGDSKVCSVPVAAFTWIVGFFARIKYHAIKAFRTFDEDVVEFFEGFEDAEVVFPKFFAFIRIDVAECEDEIDLATEFGGHVDGILGGIDEEQLSVSAHFVDFDDFFVLEDFLVVSAVIEDQSDSLPPLGRFLFAHFDKIALVVQDFAQTGVIIVVKDETFVCDFVERVTGFFGCIESDAQIEFLSHVVHEVHDESGFATCSFAEYKNYGIGR